MKTGNSLNSHAFTLIELLLVVSIISIIGITSISGFSRMMEIQDMETTTQIISNTLRSLDQSIDNHEMTSYYTLFMSGSLGFLVNLDTYKKSTPIIYSFDFVTWTWMVRSSDTGTWQGSLHFFANDTVSKTISIAMSGAIQSFSFPSNIQKRHYSIKGEVDGRNLNSYAIQYYNLTNVNNSPESEVQLTGIKGVTGWIIKSYNALIVENILEKKVLKGSGSTMDTLEKVTLSFEKNGKWAQLVILP